MSAPTPIWVGTSAVTECPESRFTEFNERIIFTQTFEGSYNNCVSSLLGRGTVGTPTGTVGAWIVESSTLKRLKGQKGQLTIRWQGAQVLPPQEANLTPENIAAPLVRHPLFAALKPEDFQKVEQAFNAFNMSGTQTALSALAKSTNPDLAKKLYDKLTEGMETYYLPSFRYSWTSFYASGTQPVANEGGYIDIPAGPFSSVLPSGLSWLREADEHRLLSGLFCIVGVTRHWLGAPDGHWDPDLYAGQ